MLALPFFHLSFQRPSLRKVTWKLSLQPFSQSKRSQQGCPGEVTHTHAQEHQDAAVTGRIGNGWPGLPWPGMKNIQGWGTAPLPAEDKPHVRPVQISESTQIPTMAGDRTCLFLHSQHKLGGFGWLKSVFLGVSPISAFLPNDPGIMRDSSRVWDLQLLHQQKGKRKLIPASYFLPIFFNFSILNAITHIYYG